MMQIEDITPETIKQENDSQLRSLRFRFVQLWENVYSKGGTIHSGVSDISLADFLSRYRMVRRQMAEHGLVITTVTDLDKELLKSSLGMVHPAEIGDLVVVENYISLGGSYARDPKGANDVDVVVRAMDQSRDEGMELKLGRLLHHETGKDCHFVYAPTGPHSTYIPIYDLILRAKPKASLVTVDEMEVRKSTRAYYEGLEAGDSELDAGNREAKRALAEGSVLDVGCGSGLFIRDLKEEGREVQGLDADPVAVEMCREKGVPILQADVDDGLPWEEGSWDNVVFIHSLEHVKDPAEALKAAERVAKSRVIVIAPLGERADPSHRQTWATIKEFKKLFSFEPRWKIEPISETGSALAILDRTVVKAGLRPFGTFTPPKPAMKGMTEAFSVDQILPWAEKRWPLDVEEKLNGFRMIAEKAGDRVRIKTEGNQDRTRQLPDLIAKLSKIGGDFILDGNVGIDRHGQPLPRISLMTLMADRPEIPEGDIVKITLFDAPYIGEDLHEAPLTDRRKKLEAFYSSHLKGDPHFGITSFNIVKDKAALQAAFKRLGWLAGSEGLVVKALDSNWATDGVEEGWAKIKHDAELKVIVLEVHAAKGGVWNYTCGLLPGDSAFTNTRDFRGEKFIDLGKTFNSQIKASAGDILTCGVEEIIPSGAKLDWLGARVIDIDPDRTKPYFANQAIQVAEEANVLQVEKTAGGPGIYLVAPHGEMIVSGKKSLIVKLKPLPDEYVGQDVYLVEDKHVLGIVRLGEPQTITQAEFKNLAAEHRINMREAAAWGFDKAPELLAYKPEVKKVFDPPIGYDPPPGVQTVIRDVRISKREVGNLTFGEGDKGTGIAQVHIMGLSDEEAQKLKEARGRVAVARSDIDKLRSVLLGVIGEHGAHVDLRLRRGSEKSWEGGEIFLGNIDGLSKLNSLFAGKRTLRAPWKQPRRGEAGGAGDEFITGPLEWMQAGANGADLFEPGTPGATAQQWGAMVRFDTYDWWLYLSAEHAKKFHFSGGRHFDGNYLFSYVPVAEGERVWMVRRLADDDHEKKVEKKLSEAEQADYEAETLRIREAKKKPEAAEPHQFRAAKWTFPNGHPRCLICGQEEAIGKVCNMPAGWYDKHDWDDEAAWAGERRALKEKKIIKSVEPGEPYFRIIKIDRKQQIVGGIVYEPDVVDTQGDWADAADIQKAMYRFMERYAEDTRRIKVLHKGQVRHFPIVECFQPEADMRRGNQIVKAGSWWMMVKVTDPEVWAEVEAGRLAGFSMGGQASGKQTPPPAT
jgi:SAM-dependent methyltransferase